MEVLRTLNPPPDKVFRQTKLEPDGDFHLTIVSYPLE